MINIEAIPNEGKSQTFLLLKESFTAKGWKVEVPYIGSAHYYVDRGDGIPLHIFSSTPPTTSYAAANLANNKYATYKILESASMPQPETILANDQLSSEDLEAFLTMHKKLVVKPIDGGHGKGITVNISSKKMLNEAILEAQKNNKSVKGAIVQRQYDYQTIHDIRILCIDYKFVGAIWRVPTRVFGDGLHTVAELIEIENASEKRGRPYYAELATIDVSRAAQYLGDTINSIPLDKQEVAVLGVANYGAGGETVDISDDLPEWFIAMAEKVSRICGLPVAGVDFMIADTPTVNSTKQQLDATIIEVNKCPALGIHDIPTSGKKRNATAQYIDYLQSI
jgi:cyanophycin synthetase